jgi:hypothetical protein
MTITVTYAGAGDGYLSSTHAVYDNMQLGSNLVLNAGTNVAYYGRNNNSAQYQGFEVFMTFTYTIPTDQLAAAYIRLSSYTVLAPGRVQDLRFSQFAYGTLAIADWRNATQFAALDTVAEWDEVNSSAGKYIYAGSNSMITKVKAAGTLEIVGVGTTLLAGSPPTQDEGAAFWVSEATGTANDPALVFATVARSRLWPVLGAQAQLTDGTWCYLESDGAATPTITLKHCTAAGAVTTVATIPTGTDGTDFDVLGSVGAQGLALVADNLNHLYVLGKVGNANNTLIARCYLKTTGYTWMGGTQRTAALVAYDGRINQVAAAWHSNSNGTIMVAVGHTAAVAIAGTGGNELSYAILDATYLRSGSGSLVRSHDSVLTAGLQVGTLDTAVWNAFANETGTGLDVTWAGSTNATWGYLASFTKEQNLGDNAAIRPGRYIMHFGGGSLTHASTEEIGWSTKDAAAKVRAVRTGASTVAYVTADADAGYGLTVTVVQYSGTASGGVTLASVKLAAASITNMPDGPAVSVAAWWDAIYNATSNTLEVYFRDSANARILRRTSVNLTTMLASGNSTTVYTNASGSASIQAVRTVRNADAGTSTLVQVACIDGATLSLVNVVDTLNLSPTAPTLTAKANYDATAAATFAWTFNDPNPGDVQSAYQMVIERTDTGATVSDSGKVASAVSSRNVTGGTLTNGLSYRWRVRTYDAADAVSPYSTYGTFSTAAGGTVTITSPASDNPAGVITDDYPVTWSVAGTTQAGYRVWVKNHGTGATINDSGWVASVATGVTVAGMVSGIENRIEVKVRNAALVESATGTRLITPDYGSPEQPTITATADDAGGFILVGVDNPAPTGDKPEVSRNDILRRVSGTSAWHLVGVADPDGEFRDYTAPAGVTLEYIARGTV